MITFIYTLVHPDTFETKYVGKTTNIARRKNQHFNKKIAESIKNRKLGNWLLKLLNQNKKPICTIIDNCDSDDWKSREVYWIDYLTKRGNDLCNMTKGGDGVSGFKHSDATKLKIKQSLTGRTLTKEHSNKLKNNWLGKNHSEESKKLMSKNKLGKKMPAKVIEKMKKARLGKSAYWNNISVSLYDIKDVFIQRFDSIKQCSEFTGCSSALVRNASNGKVKLIHKKYKIKRND